MQDTDVMRAWCLEFLQLFWDHEAKIIVIFCLKLWSGCLFLESAFTKDKIQHFFSVSLSLYIFFSFACSQEHLLFYQNVEVKHPLNHKCKTLLFIKLPWNSSSLLPNAYWDYKLKIYIWLWENYKVYNDIRKTIYNHVVYIHICSLYTYIPTLCILEHMSVY